jgi:hypothetical protein
MNNIKTEDSLLTAIFKRDKIKNLEAEVAKYKAFYHESVKAHREALERLDRIANLQGDETNRAWAIANGEE